MQNPVEPLAIMVLAVPINAVKRSKTPGRNYMPPLPPFLASRFFSGGGGGGGICPLWEESYTPPLFYTPPLLRRTFYTPPAP